MSTTDEQRLRAVSTTVSPKCVLLVPLPLCMCKDRLLVDCPGEWEPGCDLGNNERHARVYQAEPAAPVDARDALTDEQILKIAQQPETCPCYPWWLIGNVKVGDLQTAVLSFARAVLARQAAAPAEGVK